MTIIEAIKSGLRFRKRGDGLFFCGPNEGLNKFILSVEEIISDDWEVEEQKVQITRDKLFEALDELSHGFYRANLTHFNVASSLSELKFSIAKKLGFNDNR